MSDQDTIELPAFGLTLTSDGAREGWYSIGDADRRVAVDMRCGEYRFVCVRVLRGHVDVVASTAAPSLDDACERLLAEMTPDDVAAIRALGER